MLRVASKQEERMSIARKLWLGFGVLILIFVLASIAIGSSVRNIETIIDEIANVDEPVDTASYEMEINTVEIGGDVRTYLFVKERRAALHARVLVAEDNIINQKVAVKMLESLGYRADVAADGQEAVEALSSIPYSAVLMDVQMPEMDGYEATVQVRSREEDQERRIPIIAMTANALEGDRAKALGAGMDDYLPKPVKREEREAVLRRWIPEEIEDPLDPAAVEVLREFDGPEILSELVEVFFTDTRSDLSVLGKALEEGDVRSVERTAYALKGSSANMGALRLSSICAELQKAGASGELSQVPRLLEQIKAEFERVRPALERKMERV